MPHPPDTTTLLVGRYLPIKTLVTRQLLTSMQACMHMCVCVRAFMYACFVNACMQLWVCLSVYKVSYLTQTGIWRGGFWQSKHRVSLTAQQVYRHILMVHRVCTLLVMCCVCHCRSLGIPQRQEVVDVLLTVMVHDKDSSFSVSLCSSWANCTIWTLSEHYLVLNKDFLTSVLKFWSFEENHSYCSLEIVFSMGDLLLDCP